MILSPSLSFKGPKGCQLSYQRRVFSLLLIMCLTLSLRKFLILKSFFHHQELSLKGLISQMLFFFSLFLFIQTNSNREAPLLGNVPKVFGHGSFIPFFNTPKTQSILFLWDTNIFLSNFCLMNIKINPTPKKGSKSTIIFFKDFKGEKEIGRPIDMHTKENGFYERHFTHIGERFTFP